jgi:glycosyltransferase involved in cell wall biosynthesis
MHHLELVPDAGVGAFSKWRAIGSDPHFALALAGRELAQVALKEGWYALDIRLAAPRDLLSTARLYVDYGQGFSEVDALPLRHLVEESGVSGVICFAKPVRALRLDPLNSEGEFSLGQIRLRELSTFGAAWRMLRAVAAREGGWTRCLSGAIPKLWQSRGRLRGFGDWLHGNYQGVRATIGDYSDWVRAYDTYTRGELRVLAGKAKGLVRQPLISIVMPTYNSPPNWLVKCIESVRKQVYANWELCIADDASTQPDVRKLLQSYARRDKRIKVVFRERNGHIAEASNSALAIAKGDWIALLDHDDELPPHALYAVACAINEHPEVRLIYSDEDKIDSIGHRYDPYFKPEWNYDLFLGQNMISHLGVYHAGLVREVGGFRKGMEGSQDYDLALRCIERLQPAQIHHIPRVLYHWRAIEGSTAMSMDEKSYAAVAARKALREHLERTGAANAGVEVSRHGYRIRRPVGLGAAAPKVSLIIPTRDRVELLRMCVESILADTVYPSYEIVVVDNQSSAPEALAYLDELAARAGVRVLRYDAAFNYSAINNHAVAHCDGEIIGLVNNDIQVIHSEWLEEMVSHAIRPDVGAVGAMLYYPNDTIQHAGVLLGVHGVAAHAYSTAPRGCGGQISRAGLVQELAAVTAACLLVRRDVYMAVGGLDEKLQVAFNDVDFCLRVRNAGFRNLWTPFAELYHHESASRGSEDTPEKKARFEREVRFMTERWGDALQSDPAYNPNLTLSGDPFELAFPPRVGRLA